ncbi:helix-turn-helix domain-containing protein [Paracoccaceae bacterium GXU_MW_L88]
MSWKAKGIYAFIYSKPDGWNFSTRRIAEEASDGVDATLSGIKELEQAGFIKRERQNNGRVLYHILIKPHTENPYEPHTENPNVGKSQRGKTRTVSNTIREQYYKESNTHKEKASFSVLGADIIKAFEAVDGKNKAYYGNKTQRTACDFLIEEYGFDEVMKRVSFLPKTNTMRYCPTITTPVQLRDKWKQLEHAVIRYKEEHNKTEIL